MAKKGQKFVKFTDEERTEIVGKYLSGKYGYHSLAKEYEISWKKGLSAIEWGVK